MEIKNSTWFFSSKSPVFPSLNALVLVLLSAWLGVTLFVWWSATGTFEVLSAKKNPALAKKLAPMPEARREALLHHAAGEVNRRLFRGWNAAQLVAAVLFLAAAFYRREASGMLSVVLAGLLLVVVLAHVFWLGPAIEAGGRALDFADRAREAEAARQFAFAHGAYVVTDLAKVGLLGWALWGTARQGG